jgi:hypothetical protein
MTAPAARLAAEPDVGRRPTGAPNDYLCLKPEIARILHQELGTFLTGDYSVELSATHLALEIVFLLSQPSPPMTPQKRLAATAEALARDWAAAPEELRWSIAMMTALAICKRRDFPQSPELRFKECVRLREDILRVLPGVLQTTARAERTRVRRGAPATAHRRRHLARLLAVEYKVLTGRAPTWSTDSTTPFVRVGRKIFELAGFDGWGYHGEQACKAYTKGGELAQKTANSGT